MSLERACVNCERCYNLANCAINNEFEEIDRHYRGAIKEDDDYFIQLADPKIVENYKRDPDTDTWEEVKLSAKNNSEFRKQQVYGNDQIYAARNEAMRALWDVITHQNYRGDYMQDGDSTDVAITQRALEACRSCDYSSQKIVQTVENLSHKVKE